MKKDKVPSKILKIVKAIAQMSDTEISILVKRYASIPELTQSEVGAIFHLTNERIRQLEEKAINRIKKAL